MPDDLYIDCIVHSTLNVHYLKMACPKLLCFMKSEKLYCNLHIAFAVMLRGIACGSLALWLLKPGSVAT